MLVKEYIAKYLALLNIKHGFGVSGANIEDLFEEIISQKKIKLILAKTEYSASLMAIGNYLGTNCITPVFTTSGAGIVNTIPVLAEAYSSNLPMVLICGQVPQNLQGQGSFQDTSGQNNTFDISQLLAPITGSCIVINNASEIPEALNSIFQIAAKTKKPTAIIISKNIFSDLINCEEILIKNLPALEIDNEKITKFILACNQMTSPPLIILGESLIHLKSKKIILDLISKLNADVVVTPNGKGFFDHRSSNFFGITGIMGSDSFFEKIKSSKNCILIGTTLDMMTRFQSEGFLNQQNILVLNEFTTNINQVLTPLSYLEINGDISTNLQEINNKITPKKLVKNEVEIIAGENKSYTNDSIINLFSKHIEVNANIFADAGNTGAFIINKLMLTGQNLFYVSLGMGGMGNSIGTCIGAAFANGKRSYAFMGDGSYLMYGLEIHTAIEHDLPVTFVVFNNNSHGMCSTRENVFLNGESGINNFKTSFLGRGMNQVFPNLLSFDISGLSELEECLKSIKNEKGVILISININNKEEPPFRSFKRQNYE